MDVGGSVVAPENFLKVWLVSVALYMQVSGPRNRHIQGILRTGSVCCANLYNYSIYTYVCRGFGVSAAIARDLAKPDVMSESSAITRAYELDLLLWHNLLTLVQPHQTSIW